MEVPLKILFVEDSPTDLELVQRALKKGEIAYTESVAVNQDEFEKALAGFEPNIIISDYNLPQFNGMQALQLRNQIMPMVPFILVTGPNNEEIAVECMKAGADDYILKDNLTRLSQAVQAALTKYGYARQKKFAEEALAESEELFRSAFENAAIGVCLIDANLQYMTSNNTFCRMLGYDQMEMAGLAYEDITLAEDMTREKVVVEVLETGKSNEAYLEKRYRHKLGHVVWATISVCKIFSPINNMSYYVAYVLDITEKKKSEEELIRAKENAEESDRLKTAFLQNISHEIRTPLNAIIGFSTLIGNEGLQADKKKEYLEVIYSSNEQLLSVISGIIALSTLETGQDKIMEEKTHVNGLLADVYVQFHAGIKDDRIDLSYHSDLPDDRAYIITDPLKLKQILINLVGNAVKFTPRGSVKFGYRIRQEKIEFFVEDTGIGIPEEMHDKIFEHFRQADNSPTRLYGGTGLGLALSKGYAELMGGNICLKSEPGKGSLFTVTLPYKQPIEESEPVDLKIREVAPGKEKSRTILVAEDDDINFMLLEEMLRGEEIALIRARNGVEAVDHCMNNSRIDLVLMDIKMPIMNGIEATLQIKNLRPDLPVIAQTAYANESDKDEIMAVGFDDYLGKPLKFNDVIQKIYYRL